MGRLNNKDSFVRMEKCFYRAHESVQIIDVGKHIGPGNHTGRAMLCHNRLCGRLSKKVVDSGDPATFGDFANVWSWINPADAQTQKLEALQQDPNIAADVDSQVSFSKAIILNHRFGEIMV